MYACLVPLGKLTVATTGTTVPLSTNCGPLGGNIGSNPPPVPGQALRQIVLQAPASGNTGNVYLLPRGKTASNTASIIAVIEPGQTVPVPWGLLVSNGLLPENFVLDADTNGNFVYGYGVTA